MNPATQDAEVYTAMRLGFPVEKAALAITAISAKPLFNVVGGRVALLSLVGEVTTVIQTQANNTKFQNKATGETAVDMCAVLSITAFAVGVQIAMTGTPADAMVNGHGVPAQSRPFICRPGTIDINTAASSTGAIKFQARYLPLDPGAYVEAV